MTAPPPHRWVADPRIGWRILLTATLSEPVAPDALAAPLAALCGAQGWAYEAPRLAGARDLLADSPVPLLVGVDGNDVVLSAHHSAVDGLGLLTVLDRLGLGPATSSARGTGPRTTTGGLARTVARRLAEVALRPPSGVVPPDRPVADRGDVLVSATVPGSHRTAELVHAAARAVVRHQEERGRPARHVAIAIGATRDPRPDAPPDHDEGRIEGRIEDRSVLLRLRDVERLDLDAIRTAIRTAPLQTPPAPAERRPWSPALDRATTAGLRLLGPRLGSTLLVSHLGEVTAPAVERLAFHPVTAGGTGLSLGAAGLGGRTVLTLRGRATTWNDDGLEQLLEAVISLL
ncbi:hypothetical protein F9L07_26190 [Pimelobacter simplex]|uniref:Uncharacterized protein n=1 Tax=Nocardioides simplex TaxID=2045 RepID=A0A7J5DRR4_NOCSI|nr:hypothetical protein [Pimelobacter simplex]KAB2807530.1 hypothetical protein F9L07_26190 [Pimelobacter simplex]